MGHSQLRFLLPGPPEAAPAPAPGDTRGPSSGDAGAAPLGRAGRRGLPSVTARLPLSPLPTWEPRSPPHRAALAPIPLSRADAPPPPGAHAERQMPSHLPRQRSHGHPRSVRGPLPTPMQALGSGLCPWGQHPEPPECLTAGTAGVKGLQAQRTPPTGRGTRAADPECWSTPLPSPGTSAAPPARQGQPHNRPRVPRPSASPGTAAGWNTAPPEPQAGERSPQVSAGHHPPAGRARGRRVRPTDARHGLRKPRVGAPQLCAPPPPPEPQQDRASWVCIYVHAHTAHTCTLTCACTRDTCGQPPHF